MPRTTTFSVRVSESLGAYVASNVGEHGSYRRPRPRIIVRGVATPFVRPIGQRILPSPAHATSAPLSNAAAP